MHERTSQLVEDTGKRQANAAAALAALARLMGRVAAQEHFAASSRDEDEQNAKESK